MHPVTDILNILLKSIFVGFGIIIPILALIKTSHLKALEFKDLFILTAVQAVRIAGIFYFILAAKDAYAYFFDGTSYMASNVAGSVYILHTFLPPVITLLLTQLFWIKKLYMKKAALITFALLLVILPSQRVMFFVTSLHRDYLPSSWSMDPVDMIIEALLNIIVFIFIIIPIIVAGGKLRKNR